MQARLFGERVTLQELEHPLPHGEMLIFDNVWVQEHIPGHADAPHNTLALVEKT